MSDYSYTRIKEDPNPVFSNFREYEKRAMEMWSASGQPTTRVFANRAQMNEWENQNELANYSTKEAGLYSQYERDNFISKIPPPNPKGDVIYPDDFGPHGSVRYFPPSAYAPYIGTIEPEDEIVIVDKGKAPKKPQAPKAPKPKKFYCRKCGPPQTYVTQKELENHANAHLMMMPKVSYERTKMSPGPSHMRA